MSDPHFDDDDDEIIEGLYEGGHWEWSDKEGGLVFISDKIEQEVPPLQVLIHTTFKQNIDLLEQQRYKKRYQRKCVRENDVVTLQDVKDVAIYTTPLALQSRNLINILHLPAMERLLRALILYIQYYLQIADEIEHRILEGANKIRTAHSNEIEFVFSDNLQDLRLLIAKEYCVLVLGGSYFHNYHHMGPGKTRRSFTKADEIFYEAFIRISVEIVYIALGRKAYKQIDLEVNRIFRSENFNITEREYKSNTSLNTIQENVFLGSCVKRRSYILNEHSPLFDETRCLREVDFRIMGLGVIQYPILNKRQLYFERALILPEIELQKYDMNLGIIGISRTKFDIMLKEIKAEVNENSSSSISGSLRKKKESSMTRVTSKSASCTTVGKEEGIYPEIKIPPQSAEKLLPEEFPKRSHPADRSGWCHNDQRIKWIMRLKRLSACARKRSSLLL